jgi:hypothetical protein
MVEAVAGKPVSFVESSQFLPLGPVPIQRVAGPFFWGMSRDSSKSLHNIRYQKSNGRPPQQIPSGS